MLLRGLLQNWLRKTAHDALREQMSRAAPPASDDTRCDIGFVFALGMEAGGLEDLLSNTRVLRGDGFRAVIGQLEGRRIAIIITGMGAQAARRGTDALVSGHRPKFVVSAGFSGALHPQVDRGDIVLAERITDAQGNQIEIEWRANRDSVRQPHLHVGTLLNAKRLIRLPRQKHELGQQHGALAVDLESLAVAQVCQAAKVPFLAVRIISDGVEDELPAFLGNYSQQHSVAGKTGAVLGALWRQPGSVKAMYRLREEALVFSDRLARFLASLTKTLVPLDADIEAAGPA